MKQNLLTAFPHVDFSVIVTLYQLTSLQLP